LSTTCYPLDAGTRARLRVTGAFLCCGYSHAAQTFVAAICDDLDDCRAFTYLLSDPAFDVVRMLHAIDDGPPMRLARSDVSGALAVAALIAKLHADVDVCALTAGEAQWLEARRETRNRGD
jgi:hypothetical protein